MNSNKSLGQVSSLETAHEETINDCQFDFYGTQLATCDCKGFLQITTLKTSSATLLNSQSASQSQSVNQSQSQTQTLQSAMSEVQDQQTFKAHEGPAWQVAWAHPKYESVLASCGYDNKIKIFKKQSGSWEHIVFESILPSSVNCIAWAPWEHGLVLAAGTAQGTVHIFKRDTQNGTWPSMKFIAHAEGVNGLSWGPSTEPALLSQAKEIGNEADKEFSLPAMRLVTGGTDKYVKVWTFEDQLNQKPTGEEIGCHEDWVRDVAWCPSLGLQHDMIASCSEDKSCIVWTLDGKGQKTLKEDVQPGQQTPEEQNANGDQTMSKNWSMRKIIAGQVPLYQVSWSQVGNLLAVSGGDNQVHVMAQQQDGSWLETQLAGDEQLQTQQQQLHM